MTKTPSAYQARRIRRNAPPPERTRLPPPITTRGNQLAAALARHLAGAPRPGEFPKPA